MRTTVFAALAAAASLMVLSTEASAQANNAYDRPPTGVDGPTPGAAARPYGATYIPGVGFRYVAGGGARVYGYRATRGSARCRTDMWGFADCKRRY
jgi:hypothetical protein